MDEDHNGKRLALEKALGDESVDPTDLPLSLLKAITGNFSEDQQIGRGGFGAVYKGVLPNGTVAVKKLFSRIEFLEENFQSEVGCLVSVKHKNTIRFLGYCSETQRILAPYNGSFVWAEVPDRLLCFEYLSNGSLAQYLSDATSGLKWTKRFQIIKGICEGVHYLHQQRIIHMDLKPENVLLDDNMIPKIGDFGLSRRFGERQSRAITVNKAGTCGYMSPEFLNNGVITYKTDIYSLGVIIMEILVGHKGCSSVEEVVQSWTNMVGASKSHKILEQVKLCAEIGIKCTNDDPLNSAGTSSKRQISCAEESVDEQENNKQILERKQMEAITRVPTGRVMDPLIGKLTKLTSDEYKLLTGVRKQASFLKKDLSAMKAALEKVELMDQLDPIVKNWRDDIREISYDMEDCIDDFMHRFGGDDDEAGFIKETDHLLERLCELRQLAGQMEELRNLAVEANGRRVRYKIDDWKPVSSSIAVDPRVPALYQEAASLVGIAGPREKVASWLLDTRQKLKIVSIVGFGGLGKTTLAKQVYDKIGGQFHYKAFFSVSQRPDMTVLLNRLEANLGMKESSHTRGVEFIIDNLRNHLKEKRYLIVVDDLWDQSAWKIISCAFPKDGNGSRIVVTTRVEGVAGAACHNDRECIYRMEALDKQNSRMLFFNRVFGSEGGCPRNLEKVSADILKKCGGLPLAIITIASLLATEARSLEDWDNIRNSLGAQFATNPAIEDMKSILNLSYTHLPLYLRACFLYLGMYPEDHIIERDYLVKQWIAEGFVTNLHGTNLVDVGRSFFNELINRSMIQPWKTEHGEVLSCRVHDVKLDFILCKCVEDNFLSVAYSCADLAKLHGLKYKVRRLSLSSMTGGRATYGTSIAASLSKVRSFTLLGNSKYMLPIFLFKYLRVLIIDQDTVDEKGIVDLTYMNQLFQLRYLKVSAYEVRLPTEFGGLVYLETLSIRTCFEAEKVYPFALSIGKLRNLKFLSISGSSFKDHSRLSSLSDPFQHIEELRLLHWEFLRVPNWMSGLLCLRFLELFVKETSTEEIRVLGELPSLIHLRIWAPRITEKRVILDTGLFPLLKYFGFWSMVDVTAHLRFKAGAMPNLRTLVMSAKEEEHGTIYKRGIVPVGMEYLLRLQEIRLLGASDDALPAFWNASLVHPNHPLVLKNS